MSEPSPAQTSSVPTPPLGGADLVRWICTKNPFYAISAALVLWGLWVSFGNQTEESDTWLLMAGLAGYTLLLAVTALVLVRYLKLWDDTRTVLLLVVLMFLATSVTFDHVLVLHPERGTACYLLGLGLAIVISEVLLRKIQLRLPPLYRLPYYLMLALFFLYPILVRSLLTPGQPMHEPVMWGLFGFSTAAGLVFLTLLPALRRGADYVRGNGSPWPWPLYPWSLFTMLALAVPGRAILMCWSLHSLGAADYDRLVFGPYFLVPFGFALAVLLLEMGRVFSRLDLAWYALAVPILLVGLALLGHNPADPVYRVLRILTVSMGKFRAFDEVQTEPDPIYAAFLELFAARLGGDPLFLTLILSVCYYGYAMARRVPLASEGLTIALAALAVVGPNTLREGLYPPSPWPLLAPAALQLALGAWRRNPWNLLFGVGCLAGGIALAAPLPEDLQTEVRAALFIHLMVPAMLLLGAIFTDRNGIAIRWLGAVLMLMLALAAMQKWETIPEGIPAAMTILYPLILGLLLGLYGHFRRDSFTLVMATGILSYWVIQYGWAGYRAIRGLFLGFDYIVWGLGFFVVAVLVSLAKSGLMTRWIESRWGMPVWLRPTSVVPPTPGIVPESNPLDPPIEP